MKTTLLTVIFLIVFSFQGLAQCTFTSSVPYYEGFTTMTVTNQLPACWAVTNTVNCQTFSLGSQMSAGFYANPPGNYFFFTNGIQMYPNVTYSASTWYKGDVQGATNWAGISVLLGTAQSSTGLSPIAGLAVTTSTTWAPLSGTFTVASPGIYYIAIGSSAFASSPSQYLYFDDVIVTMPCSIAMNQPSMTITSSTGQNTVCSGKAFTLCATGADSYTWSSGSNGSCVTNSPSVPMSLQVTGTNSITGCVKSATYLVTVKQSPAITVFQSPPVVCSGSPCVLTGAGAPTMDWFIGQTTLTAPSITITPTVTTSYTVVGTGTNGCSSSGVVNVNVKAGPPVAAVPISTVICIGESANFVATGASSITWVTSTGSLNMNPLTVTPKGTETYTIYGFDGECTGKSTALVIVDLCLGMEGTAINDRIRCFPIPFNDVLTIETPAGVYDVSLRDVTGRIVFADRCSNFIKTNLSDLPRGFYFLCITSARTERTIKVLKE